MPLITLTQSLVRKQRVPAVWWMKTLDTGVDIVVVDLGKLAPHPPRDTIVPDAKKGMGKPLIHKFPNIHI